MITGVLGCLRITAKFASSVGCQVYICVNAKLRRSQLPKALLILYEHELLLFAVFTSNHRSKYSHLNTVDNHVLCSYLC